jgi:pentachlorophenol monooxygenase
MAVRFDDEARSASVDVLVIGSGPVGLTAALELRRRGVECRIIDRLDEPARYAKAVGIQPRTLELWEAAGVLPAALNSSIEMRGQYLYRNGALTNTFEFTLPPDIPFGFAAMPQYETERLLTAELGRYGTVVERGTQLLSFTQDDDGITAELSGPGGPARLRARYLVGCDGAHSVVRKGLGLAFEGAAFDEEYMLGDVEVDWSLPAGFGVRALHVSDGKVDDLLVCIPLPGRHRYRVSMLVPPELSTTPAAGEVAHGLEGGRRPELAHIQAVLDRLAPEPAVARNLRWSSVFRISHRIVDAYGRGRVFVAGDAAHIHPPTGAQGMNTGIQDAVNLAWKLALAVDGLAVPDLLDSYDAERRPVGEEVVGRTVRAATSGVGIAVDPDDPFATVRREGQLLVGYRGSPVVGTPPAGEVPDRAPQPGDRAPDARGLVRDVVQFPVRLFELLAAPEHTLLLYAATPETAARFDKLAQTATARAAGRLDVYAVLADGVALPGLQVPAVGDAAGEFARMYAAADGATFVVRPDGYLGLRAPAPDPDAVTGYLSRVFAPSSSR